MRPDFTFRSVERPDGRVVYLPLYRFSPGRWLQPRAATGGLVECDTAMEAENVAARALCAAIARERRP